MRRDPVTAVGLAAAFGLFALTFRGDRRHFWVVASIELLTAILFVVYEPQRVALAQALLVARSLLVIALPVIWLFGERYGPASNAPVSAEGSVTGKRQTNR